MIANVADAMVIIREQEAKIQRQDEELARLRAENESNYKKASDFQMELAKSVPIAFAQEQEAKIDTLTLALAEARELLMKHTLRVYLCRDPKTGARPDNDYPPDIQEFLNSEPGQRASEEMKALRKVVIAGQQLREIDSEENQERLFEALEAYESRGGVK